MNMFKLSALLALFFTAPLLCSEAWAIATMHGKYLAELRESSGCLLQIAVLNGVVDVIVSKPPMPLLSCDKLYALAELQFLDDQATHICNIVKGYPDGEVLSQAKELSAKIQNSIQKVSAWKSRVCWHLSCNIDAVKCWEKHKNDMEILYMVVYDNYAATYAFNPRAREMMAQLLTQRKYKVQFSPAAEASPVNNSAAL